MGKALTLSHLWIPVLCQVYAKHGGPELITIHSIGVH